MSKRDEIKRIILAKMLPAHPTYVDEVVDQILALDDWISVDERLPEYQAQIQGDRVAYVFVNAGGLTGCAEYNEGKFQFMNIPDAPVTHWKPLPEPPESKNED